MLLNKTNMAIISLNHPSVRAATQAAQEVPAALPVERNLALVALTATVEKPQNAATSLVHATMISNHHFGNVLGRQRQEKP